MRVICSFHIFILTDANCDIEAIMVTPTSTLILTLYERFRFFDRALIIQKRGFRISVVYFFYFFQWHSTEEMRSKSALLGNITTLGQWQ